MTNTTTETQAYEALRAAQLNAHKGSMSSSAQLAARDAETLFNKGDFKYAHMRAMDSLSYSLGICHPTYQAHKAG